MTRSYIRSQAKYANIDTLLCVWEFNLILHWDKDLKTQLVLAPTTYLIYLLFQQAYKFKKLDFNVSSEKKIYFSQKLVSVKYVLIFLALKIIIFDTKIVKAFCVDDGNIDWDT